MILLDSGNYANREQLVDPRSAELLKGRDVMLTLVHSMWICSAQLAKGC